MVRGLKAQNTKKMENNDQDSIAITAVLESYYFKGIYEGDIDLLSHVYNTGTLLFGDVKGQPYAKTLDQYLDGIKTGKVLKIPANHLKAKSYPLNW
jgi:hypothetical protein